jgi:hypothetical protein
MRARVPLGNPYNLDVDNLYSFLCRGAKFAICTGKAKVTAEQVAYVGSAFFQNEALNDGARIKVSHSRTAMLCDPL